MDNIEYNILTDEKDIIEYEKGLYKSFKKISPNGWLFQNYEKINNCRLRSKISYDCQKIFIAKKNNKIVGAMAGNFNKNNLQLEDIGFNLSKNEKKENFCEGLASYNMLENGNPFMLFVNILNLIETYLIGKNIDTIYGTASPTQSKMYQLFGYEILDSINLKNEKEYLLKYKINH